MHFKAYVILHSCCALNSRLHLCFQLVCIVAACARISLFVCMILSSVRFLSFVAMAPSVENAKSSAAIINAPEHSNQANAREVEKPLNGAGQHIHVKVKLGGEDDVIFFRIRTTHTLRKLMNAFCDRNSVDPSSIVFFFDDRRLRAEQTPEELEMEDGDEIDALVYSKGG